MSINLTLRATKGNPLSHAEMDANFTALKNGVENATSSVVSETPPSNPNAGSKWYIPSTGTTYVWDVTNGNGSWVEEPVSSFDGQLRKDLEDGSALVGGVEAGQLSKSVTSIEYTSNYTDAASANAAAKNLIVDKTESTARLDMTANQSYQGTKGKVLSPSGANIVFYPLNVDNISIKDAEINGATKGQLDAGIIQIAGTYNFDVSGNYMYNGGDPANAGIRPSGVNGIAISSNTYPAGKESDGVVLKNRLTGFTKAPINITTLSEGVRVGFNYLANNYGNGTCPAMQNNSARSTVWFANYVKGTEGAGYISATTGATPAYPSQRQAVFGNIIKDVGTLGLSNSERNAFYFTDASLSGSARTYSVAHNIAENVSSYFMQLANVSELVSIGNVSRDSQGAAFINAASKVVIADDLFINPNKNNTANFAAFFLRNATDINIRSTIYATNATNAIGGDNTNSNIKADFVLGDNVSIMANGFPANITNSEISYTKKHAVATAATTNLLLLNVPTGRSISLRMTVTTTNLRQVYEVTAFNNAGTVTIVNNTAVVNYKTGITTGLTFDITGGVALRARFINDGSADVTASVKCEISL